MTEIEQALLKQVASLTQERDLLQAQVEQSREAYDQLMFKMKEMLRHRFGSKSERYIDPDNPQQSFDDLFDDDPQDEAQDLEEDSVNDVVDINAYRRRRKAKKAFSDHLPRKEIIVPVSDHDKTCTCGCQKKVIRHERHERLHYVPPVFEVHVELREVVACIRGCAGQMATAEKPKHILPKARFTESVLAHIIVSKIDDRQPFYHLEKQFEKRSGVTFSRQTMAKSAIDCAEELQPLFNLMKDHIIGYDIGALDATTFQVLNEPGRLPTTKSYAYCFRGGPPGKESILYEYNCESHKTFVRDWFEGFSGYLHCDADPFFKFLFESDSIQASFCSAHSRRKYEPIAKAASGNGIAKQAMRYYRKLYRIENRAKREEMSAEQRYALRQEHSAPLLKEIKQWLDQVYPTVLPKSPLGKALFYTIKNWDEFCTFLKDGRLEIDNNLTEQEIKPFVIARKNFMFSQSVAGAKALCLHFSLIRTAKKHDLDPYHYYTEILKRIPHCESVADYEALLPWNIELVKVGCVEKAA